MYTTTFATTKNNILPGPMKTAQATADKYQPVDCDFTDELEHVSVLKIPVEVKYWDQELALMSSRGIISDIVTENSEEFIVMSNGDRIRLDRLNEIRITKS